MLTCGIKASHDGGIALIEDGRLLASFEVEKIDNGQRYSRLGRLARVGEILRDQGWDPSAVDRFVVDGWEAAPGTTTAFVEVSVDDSPFLLPVAPYVDGGAA